MLKLQNSEQDRPNVHGIVYIKFERGEYERFEWKGNYSQCLETIMINKMEPIATEYEPFRSHLLDVQHHYLHKTKQFNQQQTHSINSNNNIMEQNGT